MNRSALLTFHRCRLRNFFAVIRPFLCLCLCAQAHAACDAPPVNAPETLQWVGKLIDVLAEDQACGGVQDQDAFVTTSGCNIFVGRVLSRLYAVSDFVVTPARADKPYYQANEVATFLQAGIWQGWTELGTADDQQALNKAKKGADDGRLVIAVWRNPDAKQPGHMALIGPGPLTTSARWNGLKTPVSAAFRLGEPLKGYLGLPLTCSFGPEKKQDVHIWVHGIESGDER